MIEIAPQPTMDPSPLRVVPTAARVDLAAAERAARDLLSALGADLGRQGLEDTPRRVAEAYGELLTPAAFNARRGGLSSGSPRAGWAWCWRPSTWACRCAAWRRLGSRTVTSALHGAIRDDPRTRQEFLALTGVAR